MVKDWGLQLLGLSDQHTFPFEAAAGVTVRSYITAGFPAFSLSQRVEYSFLELLSLLTGKAAKLQAPTLAVVFLAAF